MNHSKALRSIWRELLLDTHTFLWFIGGDAQLDKNSRQLIEDVHNQRYLSVVKDPAFKTYNVQLA